MSRKIPSQPQAKLLAALFSSRIETINIGSSYINSTGRALLSQGWIEATGEGGVFPNGQPYLSHRLSTRGVDALEDYLRQSRLKRGSA